MNTSFFTSDQGDGTYRNPVLYLDYSDPDAIRVGEDYFMIASSFCNAPGLPLLHSKDLVNWKLVNYILPKVPTKRYEKPTHGCGVWAPAIRYHEGTYYACFPMPDEGIYMSTTKDPFGEWSEPVNIRPGAGWIDPCPFWDDDGRAYLVAGVAKSRIGYKSVLHMVEMQPDGMGLVGEERKIFDGNDYGEPVVHYRKPDVGKVEWEICGPDTSDDFADGLGLQWQWNANPKKEWYEAGQGQLVLHAAATKEDVAYGDVPNLLLQKWPAPEFSCVAKLHLRQMKNGDCGGAISMGMTYGLLEISKEEEQYQLNFVTGQQKFVASAEWVTEEKRSPVTTLHGVETLFVKYEVKVTGSRFNREANLYFPEETVTFSYSTDGTGYQVAGSLIAEPGRWVGTKNGLFCVHRGSEAGGSLVVEDVSYELTMQEEK